MQPVTAHVAVANCKNAIIHLWHTIRQRHYRIGFPATAMLSPDGFMMMPWGSAFSINNLHITYKQLPFLFMVAGISSLIVMPLVGKLSDKIDKFKIFAIASVWMMVMVLIYTNLTPVLFWIVVTLNITFMMGIMSRMVPAMTLTSSLSKMQDRGAYMSISEQNEA